MLRCVQLSVDRGPLPVLRDIDLVIDRGEIVALLGPNGAGKSTLLRAMAGLQPPSWGAVELNGRVALALQTASMANRSVLANLELALSWWGCPRASRRTCAVDALARVGAQHLAGRSAHGLSGGETRRVHLARALALAPDVLLLDEPFAGLDPVTRADLLYDAASVLRDPRRATVIVVHDRAEAWALADRVVVLLDGRVAADGPIAEVLDRPPDETVAEFVGFAGRYAADGSTLRLRPDDVVLDRAGPVRATVVRRVPIEDGVHLELDTGCGIVVCGDRPPGPAVGDVVRLRLVGGVAYPGPSAAPGHQRGAAG